MDRFEIMFFAFRALLVPMIFLLLFPNDLTLFFWLLGAWFRIRRSRLQARSAQVAQGSSG
jgi:hypothetical protein